MEDNLIIIRVDGGIASQISFVALGKAFEEKGYKVKYDLSWFETAGRGFYNTTNGYDKTYDLNFDMLKAFPRLDIEIASKDEIKHYSQCFFADSNEILRHSPPLYVGGYLGRHYDVYFAECFAKYFSPKETQQESTPFYALLQEILNTKSCGIHVRRGDLSQNHVVYGEPTSSIYFQRVIQLVSQMDPESIYYLFSDDTAWVRENIAPLLEGKRFKICDINTPEQGYLDLYLLSRCQVIVASQGSLGVYAKMLSPHNALLISPRVRNVFFEMENIMLVNWGERVQVMNPCSSESLPSTHCQNVTLRYKFFLYLYNRLRSKLLRKGVIQ
ncbi:alpha-1,2-fucosyltransferase [Helicobacter trogontum]|uniref:Alpha-1,2-fucosyltransferase n=1 Tax=Helicobacter trogontum TaxID=50960 RepID=A0A4U8SB21_9HELI|nr:alpha-1,2-fucosyltransferase [Helicobacter trogontum]TLD83151.1 alpha-1,2-fucosyltransferase [Helicobacter trogontum]